MRISKVLNTRATIVALLLLQLLPGFATGAEPDATVKKSIGEVNFPISCSERAVPKFQRALALLHHMMYVQAAAEFEKTARVDPECAVAYWGLAMAMFHPLWAPPTAEELKKGRAAIKKAEKLGAPSAREKAYIAAAAAFYKDWSAANHKRNLEAWKDKQKALYADYPQDIDAGAFYALALIATAPKEDKDYTNQRKASKLLEKLRARAPRHPGLYHYAIHAYDNPALAQQALDVARAYDKIAPEVPHALHMPSHIFVRLGIWPDSVEWNQRSAAAAKRQPADGAASLHYFHALDYLMYAYLQQGRDKAAADIVVQVNSSGRAQDSFAAAYGIAAALSRYPLERRQWSEAAKVNFGNHGDFPWAKYPWTEAIIQFTRGLGAARSGDTDGARQAVKQLDALYQATVDADEDYWAVLVDAQRKSVRAWSALAAGNKDEALKLMREAADLEDSVDKHPVTPGAVLPARELLGDMLLSQERAAEALQAYEASLAVSPNRLNSLYGAGRAAQQLQDPDKAKAYFAQLLQVAAQADSERAEIVYARKYLAQERRTRGNR